MEPIRIHLLVTHTLHILSVVVVHNTSWKFVQGQYLSGVLGQSQALDEFGSEDVLMAAEHL